MAAEKTIITWNFTNWVTVVLMAAIGFGGLALLMNVAAKRKRTANNGE